MADPYDPLNQGILQPPAAAPAAGEDPLQAQIRAGILALTQPEPEPNMWHYVSDALRGFSTNYTRALADPATRGMAFAAGVSGGSEALLERFKKGKGGLFGKDRTAAEKLESLGTLASIFEKLRDKKTGKLPPFVQYIEESIASNRMTPEKGAQLLQQWETKQTAGSEAVTWTDIPPPAGARAAQESSRGEKRIEWAPQPAQGRGPPNWQLKDTPEGPILFNPETLETRPYGPRTPAAGIPGGDWESTYRERLLDLAQKGDWATLTPREQADYTAMYARLAAPRIEFDRTTGRETRIDPGPPGGIPPPGGAVAPATAVPAAPLAPGVPMVAPGVPAGVPPVSGAAPPVPAAGVTVKQVALSPEEETKLKGLNQLDTSLTRLSEQTASLGPVAKLLDPSARAGLQATYKRTIGDLRALHNTGVLNVGDIEFLESIVNSPTSIFGALQSGRVQASIDAVRQQIEDQRRAIGGAGPAAAAPAAPAAPAGSMTLDQWLEK